MVKKVFQRFIEDNDEIGFLTASEIEKLIRSLATGTPDFTDEQAFQVIEWAQTTRFNQAALNLILKGLVIISITGEGGLAFRRAFPDGEELL
jgi:hypothetical protein